MRHTPSAVIIAAILGTGVATPRAEDLPVIQVEGDIEQNPSEQTVDLDAATGVPADIGEWLRSLPGVSGNRIGGHAIEPIVRGQSQTQLNVILDGAYVHGGCPNRMDPPTSYSALETYDSLTLIKGSQTVVFGGGGSGGTLLLERHTPRFGEDENLRGQAGASYKGNSDTRNLFADVAAGSPLGFVRLIGDYSEADNYEDGDGNEVRSAYQQTSGNIILGLTPNADTRLELGLEAVRGEDMLFAGAGMDAPKSDADTIRLQFAQDDLGETVTGMRVDLYRSDVEHLMDNFSLRPAGMMRTEAPSDSTTTGGRVRFDILQGEDTYWTVGVDAQKRDRDAQAINANNDQTMFFLWPDVSIAQTGLFAEMDRPLDDATRLQAGLRYDRVSAEADKAATATDTGSVPNMLYNNTYGVIATDQTEHNVGAVLRIERQLASPSTTVYGTLSRSVCTADETERYLARMGWIGNPDIEPEKHHQAEIGLTWAARGWQFVGSIYHDQVSDYILRDLGANQPQCAPGAAATDTVYCNVDARLSGTELQLQRKWNTNWSTGAALSYVHATNTSDDRPIAQIPPLELVLTLDYTRSDWNAGTRLRIVDAQDRADLLSGLDERETPGFAVMDLYGGSRLGKQVELKLGIDNLFDRTYAEHVSRSDVFGNLVQVNEPGRSAWVKITGRF